MRFLLSCALNTRRHRTFFREDLQTSYSLDFNVILALNHDSIFLNNHLPGRFIYLFIYVNVNIPTTFLLPDTILMSVYHVAAVAGSIYIHLLHYLYIIIFIHLYIYIFRYGGADYFRPVSFQYFWNELCII